MKARSIGLICGLAGIVAWVIVSNGDAEAGEKGTPLLGWRLFDDWQQTGQWWFFLAFPALAFLIPAGTGYLIGRLFIRRQQIDR